MDERPTAVRLGTACMIAALTSVSAAILLIGLEDSLVGFWPMAVAVLLAGFPIALAHAMLLGLPAYGLLSRRWRLRAWNAMLGGFVVGAAPAGLLYQLAELAATAGGLGAARGLAFRRVQRRTAGAPGRGRRGQSL